MSALLPCKVNVCGVVLFTSLCVSNKIFLYFMSSTYKLGRERVPNNKLSVCITRRLQKWKRERRTEAKEEQKFSYGICDYIENCRKLRRIFCCWCGMVHVHHIFECYDRVKERERTCAWTLWISVIKWRSWDDMMLENLRLIEIITRHWDIPFQICKKKLWEMKGERDIWLESSLSYCHCLDKHRPDRTLSKMVMFL